MIKYTDSSCNFSEAGTFEDLLHDSCGCLRLRRPVVADSPPSVTQRKTTALIYHLRDVHTPISLPPYLLYVFFFFLKEPSVFISNLELII